MFLADLSQFVTNFKIDDVLEYWFQTAQHADGKRVRFSPVFTSYCLVMYSYFLEYIILEYTN